MKKIVFPFLLLVLLFVTGCPTDQRNTYPYFPGDSQSGNPNNPPASIKGSIIISGKLFINTTNAAATKAMRAGLTPGDLNQAFLDISNLTNKIVIGWSGNGVAYTEKAETLNPDSSFTTSITDLSPGQYQLKIYTQSSVGIIGWRKDGITATVTANQATKLSISLDRATNFECSGIMNNLPGTYSVNPAGYWLKARVSAINTSGNSFSGYGLTTTTGTQRFYITIPVDSIIYQIKVVDDNGECYDLTINTTETYFADGWSIFDKIDNLEASATYAGSDDTGSIVIVIDPIDPTTPTDDQIPPVITLNGPDSVTQPFCMPWNDPGAAATDNIDGDIEVRISGNVDTQNVGDNIITYTAIDSSGNIATITRHVLVESFSYGVKIALTWDGESLKLAATNAYDVSAIGLEMYEVASPWRTQRELIATEDVFISSGSMLWTTKTAQGTITKFDPSVSRTIRFSVIGNSTSGISYYGQETVAPTLNGSIIPIVTDDQGNQAFQITMP